jgi:hypothetical protein
MMDGEIDRIGQAHLVISKAFGAFHRLVRNESGIERLARLPGAAWS